MSKHDKPKIEAHVMAGLISDLQSGRADFPSPTPAEVAKAAEVLWGKPLDQLTAEAIGLSKRCTDAMRQLLEQYPVTAAMTFGMCFGYMLRVGVEAQAKVIHTIDA